MTVWCDYSHLLSAMQPISHPISCCIVDNIPEGVSDKQFIHWNCYISPLNKCMYVGMDPQKVI